VLASVVVVGGCLLFGIHRRRSIVSYSNSLETGFVILSHTPVSEHITDLHFIIHSLSMSKTSVMLTVNTSSITHRLKISRMPETPVLIAALGQT